MATIETNPRLGEQVRADAKEFVLEYYHWDDVAKEVERLYSSLMSTQRKAGGAERKAAV